ncbi:ArnT family glycosyltransferase [Verrucomicrobium spinosum]|uniref:ArnT family glycosyltransferase n=1 Tax=Verrucomicrobium spinosum TaxID=2736 RepID=UPI0009463D94|nr:glycosyltransferase family 39 protein [Verrucomicrobium spinosum]
MTADPQTASPSASPCLPQKRPLPAWLLLLLLTALLYLPGTGDIPLMDRDEPRFAHATMEMMQRDTWLIPYFNGEYRFDKPPLTYWWMRLHYLLLGFNELAARLHSVVAVWLVAMVVFRTGKRLFSLTAGWWASVGWLTCLQALIHGRLCVADMPMVLCVTLAMAPWWSSSPGGRCQAAASRQPGGSSGSRSALASWPRAPLLCSYPCWRCCYGGSLSGANRHHGGGWAWAGACS